MRYLIPLLILCAPVAIADQKAAKECSDRVTAELRKIEARQREHSSEYLTKRHRQLFDERAACKKLAAEPAKTPAKKKPR